MLRRTAQPQPTRQIELAATTRTCPACGGPTWAQSLEPVRVRKYSGATLLSTGKTKRSVDLSS